MKKTLLLIALFLTALISNAQTEKDYQTLGLNLGFHYIKGNTFTANPSTSAISPGGNRTTSFNIGPAYSYFIADKLDVGGFLSYSLGDTNIQSYYPFSETKVSNHAYGGGFFLRKYFMLGNKVGLRTGPYVSYNKTESSTTYPEPYTSSDNSNVIETGGISMQLDFVYYPAKNLGFTAHIADLGFSYYVTHDNQHDSTNGKSANFNLLNNNLSLSVFYAFAK